MAYTLWQLYSELAALYSRLEEAQNHAAQLTVLARTAIEEAHWAQEWSRELRRSMKSKSVVRHRFARAQLWGIK